MSTDWSITVLKRRKLNTHISTLIKMFAKLIRPKSDMCWPSGKVFSQTKICFAQSRLHRKMAKIRLSRIKSSAFKILSYAGPSVLVLLSYIMVLSSFGLSLFCLSLSIPNDRYKYSIVYKEIAT